MVLKSQPKITFICADCGATLNITPKEPGDTLTKDAAISHARKRAWAIGRDRKTCYCPNCAPHRRHVGKLGTRRAHVQTRIYNA
ncbi:MAG: hypothetical protein NC311_12380 [Muribaculaceae bacterium]|nr:hypothetical protein [Muribaculaceae bacterium]